MQDVRPGDRRHVVAITRRGHDAGVAARRAVHVDADAARRPGARSRDARDAQNAGDFSLSDQQIVGPMYVGFDREARKRAAQRERAPERRHPQIRRRQLARQDRGEEERGSRLADPRPPQAARARRLILGDQGRTGKRGVAEQASRILVRAGRILFVEDTTKGASCEGGADARVRVFEFVHRRCGALPLQRQSPRAGRNAKRL